MERRMSFNPRYIDRTRAVLDGTIPLSSLYPTFTHSEAAVVAVTLLHAVGKTVTTKNGEYGQLIEAICVTPAAPIEGFKFDPNGHGYILPDWWEKSSKYWPGDVVAASRTLGLHTTTRGSGHQETRLNEQPQINALLAEPGMMVSARKLCIDAMQRLGESMPYGPSTKRRDLQDFEPVDLPVFTLSVNRWPESESMRDFIHEMKGVFDKYFPM